MVSDPGSDQPVSTVTRPARWRSLAAELRWSLTPPWTWLNGVAFNLVLSLAWLVISPLSGQPRRDWAILVGSYFAIFILADVTTTNVLGADAARVRRAMSEHVGVGRILLIKNVALLIIVGLPTLIATAIITVKSEADYRLILTLPGVAFPILTWLGVGNAISVIFPIAVRPLRERWQDRKNLVTTARWLFHLVLPYALLLAVDPVKRLPRLITRALPTITPAAASHGLSLTISSLSLWTLGTTIALVVARFRPPPV